MSQPIDAETGDKPHFNKNKKFQDKKFKGKRKNEKFPGRKPVSDDVLQKYSSKPHEKYERAPLPCLKKFSNKRYKLLQHEKKVEAGREEAARAELLLTEGDGCLEAAEGFSTVHITQKQIVQSTDITTQTKRFDLHLRDFGPYTFNFYRDGRSLALCGQMGHVAVFNWLTKELKMEINVMESLHDITFIHESSMIAVAQKKWTSIYDDGGTEIHSIKAFHEIRRLDYLPYHFLLTGLSEAGFLSYLDVSLGKEVITHRLKTNGSKSLCMKHNPYNGVVATSQHGVVQMWTPNSREPVATVLCHKAPITEITFDPAGKYMVTADLTRKVRVWDARNLGTQVQEIRAHDPIRSISVSQKGLLACGYHDYVKVFKGMKESSLTAYMTHRPETSVQQVKFCPFEDVLGISQRMGFSNIIVPGSGEANFDAAEANPYASKSAQDEALVKGLLSKIPSELITLDPITISQVNVPTLEEKLEAHRKLKYVKVPKITVNPRYRMKGKSGSAKMARRKDIRKETLKKRYLDHIKRGRREAGINGADNGEQAPVDKHREKHYENILDRFK